VLLVTGANGFVGSAVVAELVRRGWQVRAAVRDSGKVAALPHSVEVVVADLDDEASLRAAASGCDGVFHVAGLAAGSAEQTRRANVDATARILRVAADAGVRRTVFTSTTAAVLDATGLASERPTNPTVVTDPYVIAKAESEALVLAAAERGQDAVIVSPASIYGPSPRGPHSYNALLSAVLDGQVREIVDATIGWVLAEDVAIGHALAFEHGRSGHRYILCGEVASFATVLNTCAELAGSPHRVRALPPGSTVDVRAPLFAQRSQMFGMLAPQRIDDAQARGLGFAPRGVDEGLQLTVSWLRSLHPD
jgi:dihydroflavonol-4-reductase